jgi:hypothetical protein
MKMHELQQSPDTASWLAAVIYKFLPGALGAFVAVLVDMPESKRDLFIRLLVAFIASVFLGDVIFDWLRTFHLFSFLDPAKRSHTSAIDFLSGSFGWFAIGGAVMYAKRWRADPIQAIEDAKKVV